VGEIELNGRVLQARATGWIERGTRVRVIGRDASEILVESVS
jgi:membrane-bound ClpP family serine protease